MMKNIIAITIIAVATATVALAANSTNNAAKCCPMTAAKCNTNCCTQSSCPAATKKACGVNAMAKEQAKSAASKK